MQQMEKYRPEWESLNRHNTGGTAPEWFMDAKFGIYFHWGPYCIPAFGSEWYPKFMYETETGNYAYHMEHYGDPFTEWPYHKFFVGATDKDGKWAEFAPKLVSEGGEFDPDEWAQLFLDAGAKFAGPAAEHCDGWSNWNSRVNEWNSVQYGPKLDLVGLLLEAFRKKNLKTLVSMHHAYALGGDYFTKAPVQTDPALQKIYSQLSWDEEIQLYLDKIKEVVDGYQPDLLWQDSGVCKVDEWARLEFLSYYYNAAQEWKKEVVATVKDGFNNDSTVQDIERGGPTGMKENYWLADDSISPYTWCYTNGVVYYNLAQLLHTLIDHVSKNGNLLLNVLPTVEGRIPDEQKKLLLGMGKWLKKNGEAIYATRAWRVYGEGPTIMGSDHFSDMQSGTPQDIRYTRNKQADTLYAITLGWPGEKVTLQNLSAQRMDISNLMDVTLIGQEQGEYIPLDYEQDADGLHIHMPDTPPCGEEAYVLKLRFQDQIPAWRG
ncbi:MAG TPA: alpha-L-fucosidase [Firmicutes bacterium]|nr:alpha-L-fucosidase [Bacillota bacterium]